MQAELLDTKHVQQMAEKLSRAYSDAHYYLAFKTPIELLVAAILSAQTRDELVNKTTPALFERYKTAKDYASTTPEQLIGYIKSISFASNKAHNIISTCKIIVDKYDGKVPASIEALTALPGIGRKTANTILINAYNIVEGIPVDTWVIRLSYRLGLSLEKNPDKIEQELMARIPKKHWHNFAYVLKKHGKTLCGSVPICSKCPVDSICPKNAVVKKA